MSKAPINANGITKLIRSLPRYVQQAEHVQPVLCIADTDHKCAVDLISEWLPYAHTDRFLFRLAVSEAESWLLSDGEAFAAFLGVPVANLPRRPDDLPDAKREVLRLASRSRVRLIRQEVVSPFDSNKPGTGYNTHLCGFVRQHWRAPHAAAKSASLSRAVKRLAEFGAAHE
ncbi:MAG: hypothetical protein ACYC0T_20855 [Ramlibacter sp.]